ncbi:type Z 30S ribosomal protein S14 [candidate division WWE3 bacterium]|nr:type Z 30S ribosomal protein S14 [candidate division WWE3 bacterium]
MAKKALLLKSKKEPRFKVRKRNRCQICGKPRGYMRRFGICRICFRELSLKGELAGVRKASW